MKALHKAAIIMKIALRFRKAFSGAPSGTLPRAKERRTVAFLTALRAAALFEYP